MSPVTLLSAKELSRYYGSHRAVHNVSFEIHKGEVLGFLGPNGAGKSTTMQMLTGNLAPDNGEITINGYDLLEQPKQAKAQVGYLPEHPPIYKELTVKEFLRFCAQLTHNPNKKVSAATNSVIERCNLEQVTDRLIGNLSKGYQQRVGIAQAIIHNPAVVILDEPTSGLDPIQIHEIRLLIRELATEHSVILSSHILPEIQALCDRVQIIHHGQLLLNDTIDGLGQQMQTSSLLIKLITPPPVEILKSLSGVLEVDILRENKFRLTYQPEINPTEELLSKSVAQQWQLVELNPEKRTLEDVFMNLVNKDTA